MFYHEMMEYSKYPQYILLFLLIVFFIKKSSRSIMSKSDALTYSFMIFLSVTSYFNGMMRGYEVNSKSIILTLLIILLNTRSLPNKLFRQFIILVLVLLTIEYIIAYTQIIPYTALVRFGLIRPMGAMFLDLHLLSYVIVFSIFVLGYAKISGFFSLILGSYQTALAWLFLVYKKINKIVLVIFIAILGITLYSVGHLMPGQTNSMVSVVSGIFDLKLDYSCITFGCSVNVDTVDRESISGNSDMFGGAERVYDFGYYRLSYQYGLMWVVAFLYSLRRYSKIILIANVVLAVHYPVNFGLLGLVFFIWILQYAKQIESKDDYYLAPYKYGGAS